MMRAVVRMAAVVGLVLAGTSMLPAVASAKVNGPCQGKAMISGAGGGTYETIDPVAKTGVYTVPITGSADYTGSIAVSPPPAGRPISGSLQVLLPGGSPLTLKTWSDAAATKTSDSGAITWDLPPATPRGIEITVSGSHADMEPCSGAIVVRLEGGLMDSAVGIASVALTGIAGLGLLVALLGKR